MRTAQTSNLLVADDTTFIRDLVVRTLANAGLHATGFDSGSALLDALPEHALVCVLDLRMPGLDGIACLREIKRRSPATEVILITGVNEVREAVTAFKAGAFDYLTKPFTPAELVHSVTKAMQLSRAARENAAIRESVGSPGPVAELIGTSRAVTDLRQLIQQIGPTEETVLLAGESGTGKTLAARALHAASRRASGPFVSVSCPSLPRDLLESEMFGHEKGAFSGAHQKRLGRVELADGGTLFLDEIAELPPDLQAKLLTFLQDRTFFRIGGEVALHADVRIVAATHQDLIRRCREGRFRDDLYYRLAVVPLEIPPLRARTEDIASLAERFLDDFARRNRTSPLRLSPDALDVLMRHPWPGNIRELENALAHAATMHREGRTLEAVELQSRLLPERGLPSQSSPPIAPAAPSLAGRTLAEIEALALEQTLTASGQNRARAARLLGVSEKTIYNMLRRHSAELSTSPAPDDSV